MDEFDSMEKHLNKRKSNKNNIGLLTAYYEKYLIEKAKINQTKRGYSHFHPSAFGDCLRKMAYQYFCEKYPDKFHVVKEIKPNSERIFDAGHAFHHRMQKDLGEMGILRGWWKCRACGRVHGKDAEPNPSNPIGIFMPKTLCGCGMENGRNGTKLYEYEEIFLKSEPQYNFQGNTDGIVDFSDDPLSRYIVDFKSIKSERYQEVKSTGKADKKYVVQVMIYMWLTGLRKAIIYYEDKNYHDVCEVVVEYDEQMVEWIKKTSERLNEILQVDKIPSRAPSYFKSKIPCKWCDDVKICYGDSKGKK